MKCYRRITIALLQSSLVQTAVVLLATSAPALFGQSCFPPDNGPDSGTMEATVLVRGGTLSVQSVDQLYDLYPPKGQRQAFVSFREGDLVQVTYSSLLECRSHSLADVVRIIKKGRSPRSGATPTGARTMVAVLTGKEEVRNDKLRLDHRHISVDADRAKYGDCADVRRQGHVLPWGFEVSLDNLLFPTLKRGDLLRIVYFDATPIGAGANCFGRVWRLSVLRSRNR